MFLHRNLFVQERFFTHIHVRIRFPSTMFLQRDAFTYKCFYTGRGLHIEMVLRREMILQRDASTYRCSYTEILSTQRCFLHTGALRYKYFYTEIILLTQVPLHRDAFTQVFLHVNSSTVLSALRTHSFTLRFLYTQAL